MAIRTLLALALSACSTVLVLSSDLAIAQTPLTQATVQKLRKEVKLFLKEKPVRDAKVADVMTPGDALRTARQSMAELRFNDRSLARVGEQAIFEFEPNTRNFDLKRGTVLLLITPGQGQTRVRTPNAAAGIRGSALFVRYIADSNVTMVGALTNSDIEISTNDGTKVVLKAGQLGYVYNDRIGVYNFDQRRFQETSPLFKDLDWETAPAEVKAEIEVALAAQTPVAGKFEETPDWTMHAENRAAERNASSQRNPFVGQTSSLSRVEQASQDLYTRLRNPNASTGTTVVSPEQLPIQQPPFQQPPLQQPSTPSVPIVISPPIQNPEPPATPAPAPPPPRPVPAPLPASGATPSAITSPTTPTTPPPATPPSPVVAPATPVINTPPAVVAAPPAPPAVPVVSTPSVPPSIPTPPVAPPQTTPTATVVPQIPTAVAPPPLDPSPVAPAPQAPPVTAPTTTTTTGTSAGVRVQTQTGTTTNTRPLPINQ